MNGQILFVAVAALIEFSVAALENTDCKLQFEKPVSEHPQFRAFVQINPSSSVDESYLPLSYNGHHLRFGDEIEGLRYGNATIRADCAEIRVSAIVDEDNQKLAYSMKDMTFFNGQTSKTCALSPIDLGKQDAKHYACNIIVGETNKRIATLVVEELRWRDQKYCRDSFSKLCPIYWVEQ